MTEGEQLAKSIPPGNTHGANYPAAFRVVILPGEWGMFFFKDKREQEETLYGREKEREDGFLTALSLSNYVFGTRGAIDRPSDLHVTAMLDTFQTLGTTLCSVICVEAVAAVNRPTARPVDTTFLELAHNVVGYIFGDDSL